MIGPYLQAKWRWERDEAPAAAPHVDELVGGTEAAPALTLPPDLLQRHAAHSFESFLAGVLATDQHLIVPFAAAAQSLWRWFPAQVAILVLEQRAAAGAPDPSLLDTIATQGMLSFDPADHGRVGRVVLTPDNAPELFAHADVDRLQAVTATGGPPADRLAEVVLDAVFHSSRVAYPEVAEGVLIRLAEDEPDLLDRVALEIGRQDAAATREIARIGMRLDEDPECVLSLVAAIGRRDFEDFARDCL